MVRVERLPFGNVSQDAIFVISAKLDHPFSCKTKLSFYVISNNHSLEALITLYCLIGNRKNTVGHHGKCSKTIFLDLF